MPSGIGGLFADALGGDLNAQMARALAGPQPNPMASPSPQNAPGAAPGPGQPSAAAPAPGQAPAATYAPDPQNANTIDLLLKVHQQDLAASGINRGLATMASAFGTAQQQHDKLAALDALSGPQDDRLKALGEIGGIQAQQFKLQQAQQFAAGAAGHAAMLGISPADAQWLASNPEMMSEVLRTHFAALSPTEQMKNADAATKAYAQSKGIDVNSPDAQSYRANLIASATGGSDLEQRQYLQEKSAGLTTDDYATWRAKKAASATTMQTQAKDVQEFKDTATQDYTSVKNKLQQIQPAIERLKADPASAQAALQSFRATTGKWSTLPIVGVDPKIRQAAIDLQTVQAALTGESLASVKNVRNIREFNTLGQAATGGLDAGADPKDFAAAIDNIYNRHLDAMATAEMSVGHKLTGNLVGHGNRDLLDPKNPYYNGATEEEPAIVTSPEDVAKLSPGRAFVIPSGPNKGKIGYAQ